MSKKSFKNRQNQNFGGGGGGNQNNQQQPPVKEKPEEQVETVDEDEQQLMAAVKWLAKDIRKVREWKSRRDQRLYATATLSGKAPNKEYNNGAEVARDLLDIYRNENTYITYNLSYNNASHIGRLIKVTDDNKLIFAIEPEYNANASGASLETFQRSSANNDESGASADVATAPTAENVGFGSLLGG